MNIYVGTCGFSYPDWDGFFYPPGIPPRDRLRYYADRFRAVELDSFFYHLPAADAVESMVKRTRKEFKFTVKLHRSITHEFDQSAAEYGRFRKAIEPLVDSERLGAVLAQFPPAFRCTRESVHILRMIREELDGLPLAVEFRHRTWNRPDTFDFLRKHRIAYCAVDEPDLPSLIPPETNDRLPQTAEFVYVRLHGRNSAKWLHARTAAQRHDYLYREEELEPWAQRIEDAAREASAVYVMFSNVYEAKAITNARSLSQRLGLPLMPSSRRAGPAEQTEMALMQ